MDRGSDRNGPRLNDEDAQQIDDTERRSELARYTGEAFPAARDQVIAIARSNGAPRRVISLLETLPLDRPIESVEDAWESSSH